MQWREAATLMLVTRFPNKVGEEFKVLMMKRSSQSKFMPSAQVFPGGVIDKADFNPLWLEFLKSHRRNLPNWTAPVQVPMIYEEKETGEIPREIAFRINAVRETFEETGILLTTEKLAQIDDSWRHRVHEKPCQFLQMCQDLNICPDIWNLHEWSDWLTPLHLKTKSRFDTMFYISFIDDVSHFSPPTSDGDKEVTEADFKFPKEALKSHLKGDIWLAPPQFYELSRLAAFSSFSKLKSFSKARATNHGIHTWFPVVANCQNGTVALYPGDDAYPSNPDINGTGNQPKMIDATDFTIEEYSKFAGKKNRMESTNQTIDEYSKFAVNRKAIGKNGWFIDCNIQDPCGHIHPVMIDQSKL